MSKHQCFPRYRRVDQIAAVDAGKAQAFSSASTLPGFLRNAVSKTSTDCLISAEHKR